MLKYLWRNKLLILLLLLIIAMCPTTISLPEQGRTESIITAVGVDKKDDEYEITVQYIVPQASGGQENLKVSSGKGKSVGEVFEKLNLEIGKTFGFAHCRFLAFNDEAGKENLTKILDYLLRRKTNTNNIVLISTKESAKDLLSTATGIDSDLYTFLSNSGNSSELKAYNDLTTIGDFYKTYLGPVNCMCVYIVDTKEPPSSSSEGGSSGGSGGSSGGSSSGSESGGSSSSSGGAQKEIVNEERMMILKDSKILIALSEEESNNLVWFNGDIERIQFEVKGFKDERAGNVDTMIDIFKRRVKKKVYFENGVPHFKLITQNYVRASQLIAENLTKEDYEVSQNRFDDDFTKYVKDYAIQKVKKAEEHFKEYNYDVINCYELFYKFKTKELKEYLKTHSKEDFIKDVVFEYDFEFIQGS